MEFFFTMSVLHSRYGIFFLFFLFFFCFCLCFAFVPFPSLEKLQVMVQVRLFLVRTNEKSLVIHFLVEFGGEEMSMLPY